MELPENKIAIIFRSSGERTETFTLMNLQTRFGPSGVFHFQEDSFHSILTRIFMDSTLLNFEYLVMIDGDMILRPKLWKSVIANLDFAQKNIVTCHTLAHNKFINDFRFAGMHIYSYRSFAGIRDNIVNSKLNLDNSFLNSLRPETYLKRTMVDKGWAWKNSRIFTSFEDYEQDYADIFNTGLMFARKNSKQARNLLDYWRIKSLVDFDFEVLISGYSHGISKGSNIGLNKKNLKEYLDEFYPEYLTQKPKLSSENISVPDIREIGLKKYFFRSRPHTVNIEKVGLLKDSSAFNG